MICGAVNEGLEPWIELAIQDRQGGNHPVQALLDTGFNGFLTLPTAWLLDMGLECVSQVRVTLADGSEIVSDLFAAIALWDGKLVEIDIEAAETDPLVGMAMLADYDLRMRVINQGEVAISSIPSDV